MKVSPILTIDTSHPNFWLIVFLGIVVVVLSALLAYILFSPFFAWLKARIVRSFRSGRISKTQFRRFMVAAKWTTFLLGLLLFAFVLLCVLYPDVFVAPVFPTIFVATWAFWLLYFIIRYPLSGLFFVFGINWFPKIKHWKRKV